MTLYLSEEGDVLSAMPNETAPSDFAPFVGYVVTYKDNEEAHCGILEHVEFPHMVGSASGKQDIYFHFKGRSGQVVAVCGRMFLLERFR